MHHFGHDVTDAELAVLLALWRRGDATTRDLTDEVYPGETQAHYVPVQNLLGRPAAKGCDRRFGPHVFTAFIDCDNLLGRPLRPVVEQLCEGSLTLLLTHLLDVERLSRKERQELRALLDRHPESGPDAQP